MSRTQSSAISNEVRSLRIFNCVLCAVIGVLIAHANKMQTQRDKAIKNWHVLYDRTSQEQVQARRECDQLRHSLDALQQKRREKATSVKPQVTVQRSAMQRSNQVAQ